MRSYLNQILFTPHRIATASIVFVCIVGAFIPGFTHAAQLDAPTVISPKNGVFTEQNKPVITGVTPAGTTVAVVIDGVLNGHARVAVAATHGAPSSFAYQPFLPLKPGTHTVEVFAESESGSTRSAFSKPVTFTVEGTIGVPVVLRVDGSGSTTGERVVVGLAPRGSVVDIYVDDQFIGHAGVRHTATVTGDFAFTLPEFVAKGTHRITAVTRVLRADGTTRYSAVSRAFVFGATHRNVATQQTASGQELVTAAQPNTQSADTLPPTNIPQPEPVAPSATAEPPAQTPRPEPMTPEPGGTEPEQPQEPQATLQAPTEPAQNPEQAVDLPKNAIISLNIIGWASLVIAASLFVYQVRRHRSDIDRMLGETDDKTPENTDKNA